MQSPSSHIIQHVPAHRWAAWREANAARVIDVREPMEWATGTLPDVETISLAHLPNAAASMDKNEAILLVCATGNRSTTGAAWMTSMGFTNVASLAGGVVALGLS